MFLSLSDWKESKMDWRKAVKDILVSDNTKKIGIHLPLHVDIKSDVKPYQDIYKALVKQNAGKAFLQTTTELTRGPKMDLHDYLMQEDPNYAQCK